MDIQYIFIGERGGGPLKTKIRLINMIMKYSLTNKLRCSHGYL